MPKTTSNKSATVTIRLGPQTRELAERYAKAREMSLGEFLRYTFQVYADTTPEHPEDH